MRAVAALWTSPSTNWFLRRADSLFGRRVETLEDREELLARYESGVEVLVAFYRRTLEVRGLGGEHVVSEPGPWTKRELDAALRAAAEALR
jgi:hypothetical protein